MDQTNNRDDALFEALNKSKKKKKRRTVRTVIIVLLVLGVLLTAGVFFLRRQVAKRFASGRDEVVSAEASIGSISTQVSGSGTLLNVDEESVSVPAGVTVEELLVSAQESVAEGQLLVKVDAASVQTAMSSVQSELKSLDKEITSAAKDTVDSRITAGVAGRVKLLYAEKGDDVAKCMYEHGALAILSLDGKMAVEIDAGRLAAGDAVVVRREDGSELEGTVDAVADEKATILVTDNGPRAGETVTVLDAEGTALGTGTLSIHSPLRVSGISGTVSGVSVQENRSVSASSTLFTLTDTSYSAGYQTLLRERKELEETLLELMEIYRSGGVCAPFAGTVTKLDYDESAVSEDAETALLTLSPDEKMQVSISVDESNILTLEPGQTASVTIRSIGDTAFEGVVTEINKTASSSSGVTRYSAVVTMDKTPEMLQGMSARVVVRIQGVDDAVIIPVEALHQTSSTSYVYTSYDEETKEFGGLREVTVGITNSSYAEISSGLQAGETVYYTEAEDSFFGGMSFGGGSFPGGDGSGGFPGGGSGSGGFPGGGELSVHSAWKAMGTDGTVLRVSVSEGKGVRRGGALFTIAADESSDQAELLAEYRAYEEIMEQLFRLYTEGVVTAPCDGCVSGVDESILELLSASGRGTLLLLANAPGDDPDGEFANCVGMVTAVNDDGTVTMKMQAWNTEIPDYTDLSYVFTAADSMTVEATFAPPTIFRWDGESWSSGGSADVGDVFVVAYGGAPVWMIRVGHNELPEPSPEPTPEPSPQPETPEGPGQGGGTPQMPSGGGSFGSFSGSGTQQEETARYSTAGTTILSVTPQETVTVSITVDELDILSVHAGQEVQVTLDALPGQAFSGVITEVDKTASNEGGNSKYSAVVQLERTGMMLGGMNASASIVVEEKESVLLIPSAAIVELEGQTMVYTSCDPQTQTLGAPVPVELGLSDGEKAEILSGLSEGDAVWYAYYDKLELKGLN